MLIIDINPDGETHETVIPDPEPATEDTYTNAVNKLVALGLTPEEIAALIRGTA